MATRQGSGWWQSADARLLEGKETCCVTLCCSCSLPCCTRRFGTACVLGMPRCCCLRAVREADCCKQPCTLIQMHHTPASTSSQTGAAAWVGTAAASRAAVAAPDICRGTLETGSKLIDQALYCSALVFSSCSSWDRTCQEICTVRGKRAISCTYVLVGVCCEGNPTNKRWFRCCCALLKETLFKTTASPTRCSCSIRSRPGHCLNTGPNLK